MKLFIVTRADLSPGAQAAQSCHAAILFQATFKAIAEQWYRTSNNLVLLSVPNEESLQQLIQRAKKEGVLHAPFHEPDFGNALTAVALAPSGQRIVSSLPLALKAAA